MTVCSRASGAITSRQFSKLPAMPWINSSTGPLPASSVREGFVRGAGTFLDSKPLIREIPRV